MFRAIIFDIDGTLTHNIAWVYLTEKVGGSIEYNDAAIASWGRGEITEQEAKTRLIDNWSKGGKGFKKDWLNILTQIPLREDALKTIRYLKDKGYLICMITGSFDTYAEIVGNALDIPEWYANTKMIWDNRGKLIDIDTVLDDKQKKIDFFNQFCQKHSIKYNECVPVGDSGNDIGLFELSGNGIAVRTEFEAPDLEKMAWKKVHRLGQIMEIL